MGLGVNNIAETAAVNVVYTYIIRTRVCGNSNELKKKKNVRLIRATKRI